MLGETSGSEAAVASGPRADGFSVLRGLDALRAVYYFATDPLTGLKRFHESHGRLVAIRLPHAFAGSTHRIFLAVGPRYNERVLGDTKSYRTSGVLLKGPDGSAQRRVRNGLVAMNGPKHKHYRKMMLPALRRGAVEGMAPGIVEIVEQEIAAWPVGGNVDIWPLSKQLMQHVAIASLFAADKGEGFAEACEAARQINAHVRMNGNTAVRMCPVNLPGTPYRGMLRHAEQVEQWLIAWAKKRRGAERPDDLISMIVNRADEQGREPSDQLVGRHVPTLFGAAYETCQTALTWTLLLLAQHPKVYADLLDEVGADDDDAALPGRVDGWPLLEAVIKESMRILPPVPFQMRVAIADTDLVDCDVKEDQRVYLSPFLTNRLPELYPDADRFRPERWETLKPSQYEYLAFSAGPRTCIGTWFAMTVLKIAITKIVRRYRLTAVPGARIDRVISAAMSPKRGVPMIVAKQDRKFSVSALKGNVPALVRFA